MIEFKVKPFIDAQAVLVQCSIVLRCFSDCRETVRPEMKDSLVDQISPLMDHLIAHELHFCRIGLEGFLLPVKEPTIPSL
jgi:hypothetical protein